MGIPLNPVRRPARRASGGTQTPPTSEGGALRSQDLRTPGDPTTLDGSIIRVDPATGNALPVEPAAGEHRRQRPPDHRLRAPQPVPVRVPARHLRDLGRRRGLEHHRGDQPDPQRLRRHGRQLGLALLRGQRRQAGYDAANLNICENLYASNIVRTATYTYAHSAKVDPEDTCPTGELGELRDDLQPAREPVARGVRRRAVLRRLRARMHLGHGARLRRNAQPLRRQMVPRRGVRSRGRPVRPRRGPLLRRHPGRQGSSASTTPPATRPRRRWPPPPRRAATCRCRWCSTPAARATRTATRSPTPGTPTATAPYDDSDTAVTGVDLRHRRHLPRRPQGHRPERRVRHRRRGRHGRQHAAHRHHHLALTGACSGRSAT